MTDCGPKFGQIASKQDTNTSRETAPGALPHRFTARMLKGLQFGRGLPMKLDGD